MARRKKRRVRTRTVYVRPKRRRSRTMARRRYTRRRSYSRGMGSMKPIIDGVIGGIAAEAGQKFLGGYGAALGTTAAGYFMKNSTLKTIGGFQLGSAIGDQLPMIGGGGSVAGGAFE